MDQRRNVEERLVALVWTKRDHSIRIITMRRARRVEGGDTCAIRLRSWRKCAGAGEDRTDWDKFDAMTEEELEASIAADPDDIHEELDWSKAFKGLPPFPPAKKACQPAHRRRRAHWFKATGKGYPDAHQPRAARLCREPQARRRMIPVDASEKPVSARPEERVVIGEAIKPRRRRAVGCGGYCGQFRQAHLPSLGC